MIPSRITKDRQVRQKTDKNDSYSFTANDAKGDIRPSVIGGDSRNSSFLTGSAGEMSGSEANQAGTSDSAKSDDKRELQDLSLNDAEELQAFVAKRKWFEVKLVVCDVTIRS